jgi:hypothetical protein
LAGGVTADPPVQRYCDNLAEGRCPGLNPSALSNSDDEESAMETSIQDRNTIFVLFGAGGDLSLRLIMPALFNLHLDRRLPERFLLLGVDRLEIDDSSLLKR